jgi:hypothetical protein
MNLVVKTSFGILLMIILINADIDQLNIKFNKQCQVKKKVKNKLLIFF